MRQCEKCWETYDTEKRGANEYFCSKCNNKSVEDVNDGMD